MPAINDEKLDSLIHDFFTFVIPYDSIQDDFYRRQSELLKGPRHKKAAEAYSQIIEALPFMKKDQVKKLINSCQDSLIKNDPLTSGQSFLGECRYAPEARILLELSWLHVCSAELFEAHCEIAEKSPAMFVKNAALVVAAIYISTDLATKAQMSKFLDVMQDLYQEKSAYKNSRESFRDELWIIKALTAIGDYPLRDQKRADQCLMNFSQLHIKRHQNLLQDEQWCLNNFFPENRPQYRTDEVEGRRYRNLLESIQDHKVKIDIIESEVRLVVKQRSEEKNPRFILLDGFLDEYKGGTQIKHQPTTKGRDFSLPSHSDKFRLN